MNSNGLNGLQPMASNLLAMASNLENVLLTEHMTNQLSNCSLFVFNMIVLFMVASLEGFDIPDTSQDTQKTSSRDTSTSLIFAKSLFVRRQSVLEPRNKSLSAPGYQTNSIFSFYGA